MRQGFPGAMMAMALAASGMARAAADSAEAYRNVVLTVEAGRRQRQAARASKAPKVQGRKRRAQVSGSIAGLIHTNARANARRARQIAAGTLQVSA